ncbi:FecR domain-containing protein [Massilia sp. BJB1822]|uniref:FecR domain-containing protein n=1 Tax=Massilia sp. BJB1822 TaxID=2744470 RepID=UPI0015944A32|nr:FecR domain-containing protein [Massilia sp. BJB1822]NVD96713.1 FecR domain-containing protein [Massilia sp. BJB1822]
MSGQGAPASAAAVDPRAAREAARWMMRMHSGEMSAADQRRCAQWRASDPENEKAWQRAERVAHKLGMVPPALGAPALRNAASDSQRRTALTTLALALGAIPLGWAVWRTTPWDEWNADQQTAAGERREISLPDGGSVVLNTATALDVQYDSATRRLRLYKGEILVQTAADPLGRHFIVESPQGAMRAIGTRFVVRLDGEHTRLGVLEGAVEVRPASHPDAPYVVRAGRQSRFDAAGGATEVLDPNADAWNSGVLYAEKMPLADFVAELARYRPGLLRCDPSAARLRVSGAFQLRDTDSILQALAASLPVRVQTRTRYWVTLTHA